MIKLVFTIRRRQGMTREEFQRYWRDEHAELVKRHAGALRIRRYVQTHARETEADAALAAARGSEPGHYDGVAELWWDSVEDVLAAAATEEGLSAAKALLEDEQRFIDLPSSPIWLGEENVVTMQGGDRIELRPIGSVLSPLTDLGSAPKQGDEGAPSATIVLYPEFLDALHGVEPGDEVIVLTWLDRAARDALSVHPRGDVTRDRLGVFATRSPDRPNPIGLHRVRVEALDGAEIRVRDLEAIDGTPVLDLKPALSADVGER